MPNPTLTFLSMIRKFIRLIQSTIGLSGIEAKALLAMMPLLLMAIFSEPLLRWFEKDKPPLSVRETVYLDSLAEAVETNIQIKKSERAPALSPSAFDPNTATLEELTLLGIPEKISKRIVQYRTKGGSFRIKSDLAKMYGMDSSLYKKLHSFILLPEALAKKEFAKRDKPVSVQLDLNVADTSAFKSIRGIGSVLAKRIVKYRDGLGGFVKISQLREVFGLDSMVLKELNQFYIAEDFNPKLIQINHVTEKELEAHPYISAREAKSIFTYRTQHGNFVSLADLLKIKTLSESTVNKLTSYLSFD